MIDAIVHAEVPLSQLVPTSYAEKAMSALMQLHSELMEEKERRVDLFRTLMEREQALAELKMYVKLLEEKVGRSDHPAAQPTPPPRAPMPRPPPPSKVNGQRRPESWRSW